ncbi:MAG TPA: hypothetical protein VHZ25_07575 [Acidobacteriaceae bacterium]|jgi:hypothetical protein|nr:hypothetical protein [Acidobacteriaceae bacterium]
MAATTATYARPIATSRAGTIPWYLWCAALAVTSVTIGAHWDVSWHRSIGRDTFWTPAHLAIYMCGVLAGISCGYLIVHATFFPTAETTASSVHVFGFRGPLGAFIAAWGGIAMLTSAPFDNWWHNAYGLDVKIVSPPHTLLMLGIFAVELGALLLILARMNRGQERDAPPAASLQWLMLYICGLMMVLTMFFRMEYTWDVELHSSGAYTSMAIGVPLYFAAMWKACRHRWACTLICGFYMLAIIAFILILPLFPAAPKLGPVYTQVTQFIPPKFPILLIVPAIVLDLLWRRFGQGNKLLLSLVSGPIFVLTLVAAEWPFATFLMTSAAKNRFFGTGYVDYGTPSWSADVTRHFVDVQHGAVLWTGLGWAMLYAAISVWLGLLLGDWMRKVKR